MNSILMQVLIVIGIIVIVLAPIGLCRLYREYKEWAKYCQKSNLFNRIKTHFMDSNEEYCANCKNYIEGTWYKHCACSFIEIPKADGVTGKVSYIDKSPWYHDCKAVRGTPYCSYEPKEQ